MKHISESIIGRKGTSGTLLQQGDIIITRLGNIYMVLTDQNCLKKILDPNVFRRYDMSKGAYVRTVAGKNFPSFMELSSFNDKLENIDGPSGQDIVQVWRNFQKQNIITSNDDINQIIQEKNLKLLQKSYKLIWKR